jgi:FKBP-type peptidyl-prolyl cis-trans isomerase
MNFQFKILIIVLFVFALNACNSNAEKKTEIPKKNAKESLVKANKYLVNAENEEINNYVNRRSWKMIKTGTGLRYEIYEQGTGPKIVKGQIIVLKYELRLITGDLVYSSELDGERVL